MKYLIVWLLLFSIPYSFAKDVHPVVKLKQELINELKILIKANENLYSPQYDEKVSHIWLKFIEEAHAQSEFQCLYGGWPSNLLTVNGKKYCRDAKKSSYYEHSYACAENELSCPSVLFGKEVCAPYANREDRVNAYNNCEKKQKPIDFTQGFSGRDHQMIVEYIKIAKDICENNDPKKAVSKINCSKILTKTQQYEESMKLNAQRNPGSTPVQNPPNADCDSCNNQVPGLPTVGDIAKLDHKLQYEILKKNYRESPLCNPKNNYPPEEIKNHALMGVGELMNACSLFGKEFSVFVSECTSAVDQLAQDLEIDEETRKVWDEHLAMNISGNNTGMYRIMAHAKKMIYQNPKDQVVDKYSKFSYEKYHLLAQENGELTCPFPSFDAFNKALTGHKKLKSKLKKNILTIVDYTMPSSQRRMFTFDMNSYSIMHNTWVSHGSGKDGPSADENGANPKISNTPDSNLSSDGFILTAQTSHGSRVGDSIILKGIDQNNKNIQQRQILLHGDVSTNGGYKILNFNDEDKNARLDGLKDLNINTDDLYQLRYSANAPGHPSMLLGESWGCLGVPDYPSLDLKTNTYTSQLQSLRRDLAGESLIFSYSGENMESAYFD